MLFTNIAKRCLALTEKGYICLAPQSTGEGDAVYILAGGKVPFILRPVDSDDDKDRPSPRTLSSQSLVVEAPQCRVMGDCHVEGIMNGEFIKDHDLGQDDFQDTILL